MFTPLCLAEPGLVEVRGGNVTLAGWGLTSCPSPTSNPFCAGGIPATALQQISLPVPTAAVCSAATDNYGAGKALPIRVKCVMS